MPEPGRIGRLTEEQRARLDIADTDLKHARTADLVSMTEPDLIMEVEKLRRSLDEAVRLVKELVCPNCAIDQGSPPDPTHPPK